VRVVALPMLTLLAPDSREGLANVGVIAFRVPE
jgi:hypothetical protein